MTAPKKDEPKPVASNDAKQSISGDASGAAQPTQTSGSSKPIPSTASTTPQPAGDGLKANTTFPPGQWVKVFTKFEDLPNPITEPSNEAKFTDGWLDLSSAKKGQFNIDLKAVNSGIRMKCRKTGGYLSLSLRVFYGGEGLTQAYEFAEHSSADRGILFYERSPQQRADKRESLTPEVSTKWPTIKPNEDYTLECAVIGKQLVARMNGLLVTGKGGHISEAGVISLSAKQMIRDIEVINLDGLPEADALRILGVDETGNDLRAVALTQEQKVAGEKPQEDKLSPIPELKTLNEQFTTLQVERVTAPFDADVAKLNTSYLGGLDREIAKERAKGQLDGVLALETEKKLIADKQPLPAEDDDKVPAALKAMRQVYRDAYAKLEATRTANLKQLTDPLAIRLKQLESTLTQANRIDHAKTVRDYREGLGTATEASSTPLASKAADQPADKNDSVADLKGSSWRKAAEWAVGLGAWVRIREGKRESDIKRLADVPKSKFDIVEVDFKDATGDQKKAVTDSGLSLLASQKDLKLLNIQQSSVTDAGLPVLKNFPKLETLNLIHCTGITGAGVLNLKNPSGLVRLDLGKR